MSVNNYSRKRERRLNRLKAKYLEDMSFHEQVNSTLCLKAQIPEEDREDIDFFSDWILNHPRYDIMR